MGLFQAIGHVVTDPLKSAGNMLEGAGKIISGHPLEGMKQIGKGMLGNLAMPLDVGLTALGSNTLHNKLYSDDSTPSPSSSSSSSGTPNDGSN